MTVWLTCRDVQLNAELEFLEPRVKCVTMKSKLKFKCVPKFTCFCATPLSFVKHFSNQAQTNFTVKFYFSFF